jgi:hypothetical protein
LKTNFLYTICICILFLSTVLVADNIVVNPPYYQVSGTYNSNPSLSTAKLVIDQNANGIFGDGTDITFYFPYNTEADWILVSKRYTHNVTLNLDFHTVMGENGEKIYLIDFVY